MDVSEQARTNLISEKEIKNIIETDLERKCQEYSVVYIPACPNETTKQQKNRRERLRKLIKVSKE